MRSPDAIEGVGPVFPPFAAVTALHFGADQLYEYAGIVAGMMVLFYLRGVMALRERLAYALMSGAIGVVVVWGVGDLVQHFWLDVPVSLLAVIALFCVLAALPLVELWRHMWRWLQSNPQAVGEFLISFIPGRFRRRDGGGDR